MRRLAEVFFLLGDIIILPREGVGVALKAQVVQWVTYHASPEGSLIYTVFTQKFQKR